MAEKIKVRELISRATYKTVKNMNREQMNDWAKALYNDAMRDCEAASMLALKDEFGFSTKRLARFMDRRNNTIICINQETTENSVTFSRAAAADVVVEVNDGVIVGLKNNTSNVNTDNYTIADGGGSITIKKEYLSGLTDGAKTFHILLEDETDIEYLITVGD